MLGLVIRHRNPIFSVHHRVIICGQSVLCFSTLSHKQQDFQDKILEHKMCVLLSSATFMGKIFHSGKNSMRCCHKCLRQIERPDIANPEKFASK
jgi:hypothetical protein